MRSDDISHVNLKAGWKLLAKATKSLISCSLIVHTEKMSSMNRFQTKGLLGLVASSCFSVCAIKMTAKATAILVPIATPWVCKCLPLN